MPNTPSKPTGTREHGNTGTREVNLKLSHPSSVENFKPKTKALDVIWSRINGNTHQSVIIFASEQNAKDEAALRNEHCKKTAEALGHKMEDGTMGSIISIMSGLLPAIQNLASKLIRSRAFIPSVH